MAISGATALTLLLEIAIARNFSFVWDGCSSLTPTGKKKSSNLIAIK
jgi:hypothetical protein